MPRLSPLPGRVDASLYRVFTARRLLIETAFRSPGVEGIARQSGLSPFYFMRLFRETFGETPHRVVMEAKLSRAKSLLLGTDLPITEICFECGYESLGSFSYLFRQHTGVSPREYRRSRPRVWPVAIQVAHRFVPLCLLDAFR